MPSYIHVSHRMGEGGSRCIYLCLLRLRKRLHKVGVGFDPFLPILRDTIVARYILYAWTKDGIDHASSEARRFHPCRIEHGAKTSLDSGGTAHDTEGVLRRSK